MQPNIDLVGFLLALLLLALTMVGGSIALFRSERGQARLALGLYAIAIGLAIAVTYTVIERHVAVPGRFGSVSSHYGLFLVLSMLDIVIGAVLLAVALAAIWRRRRWSGVGWAVLAASIGALVIIGELIIRCPAPGQVLVQGGPMAVWGWQDARSIPPLRAIMPVRWLVKLGAASLVAGAMVYVAASRLGQAAQLVAGQRGPVSGAPEAP
jgi:hypothetical protein